MKPARLSSVAFGNDIVRPSHPFSPRRSAPIMVRLGLDLGDPDQGERALPRDRGVSAHYRVILA